MTVAVVHVNWSRSEVAAALEAVRSANAKVGGRKQALEQLGRAERKLLDKANPKARVALHFGERPLSLLGAVLAESADPAAISALTSLEKAALSAKRNATRPGPQDGPLHNPLADTRDRRARHLTGRPRPIR